MSCQFSVRIRTHIMRYLLISSQSSKIISQKSPILFFALIFSVLVGLYLFYPCACSQEADIPSQQRYDSVWPQKSLFWKNNTPNDDKAQDQGNTSIRIENNNPNVRPIYTYQDLEAQLCGTQVDWFNKTLGQNIAGTCPKKGIVTVASGGRTGNLMWEYAAVWAVAQRTGLKPYVPNCIRSTLDQIFENLTVPDFGEIANCPIEFNKFVKSIREWTWTTSENIIMPRFLAEPTLIATRLKEIRKEYRFIEELRNQAQEVLRESLRILPPKEYNFVSVHVRRTDYINYLKKNSNPKILPIKPQFFINAMNYYKAKYSNCLFIYISDDPPWCSKNFGNLDDVVVTSNHTAALDLAIMAACNHSIFDYGTFGEWGSILAGGEIVTQDFRKTRDMSQWTQWIQLSEKPAPSS